MCRYALFSQAWSQFIIIFGVLAFMYCTIKTLAVKNFDKFGKLQQFVKFFINFTNFIRFPMQTDFNLPNIFHQTPYNPYSLNFLPPKISTIR